MAHSYTVKLKDKEFPITDITNIQFNMDQEKGVELTIKTKSNGDFFYDCELSETDKAESLYALKSDLISTLVGIAEGRLPKPDA